MSNVVGCKCGAVTASKAALAQMGPVERNRFWKGVRSCATCRRDRRAGIGAAPEPRIVRG